MGNKSVQSKWGNKSVQSKSGTNQYKVNRKQISTITFADGQVILGKTKQSLQKLLNRTHKTAKIFDMKKCSENRSNGNS